MEAALIVGGVVGYGLIGFIFAAAFVTRGVGAIDPAAKNASWGFRAVLVPGTVALWPFLAKRWWMA
jgi:hypothetical protein